MAGCVLLCPEEHIHHMRSVQSGQGKWDSIWPLEAQCWSLVNLFNLTTLTKCHNRSDACNEIAKPCCCVCVCVCLDNKSSLLYFHLDKTDTVLYSPELDKYVLLWCEIKQQNVSMSK